MNELKINTSRIRDTATSMYRVQQEEIKQRLNLILGAEQSVSQKTILTRSLVSERRRIRST